jgi:hypothetical protein
MLLVPAVSLFHHSGDYDYLQNRMSYLPRQKRSNVYPPHPSYSMYSPKLSAVNRKQRNNEDHFAIHGFNLDLIAFMVQGHD